MTDREAEQLLTGAKVIEAHGKGAISDEAALAEIANIPESVASTILSGISETEAEPELTEADQEALKILNGEA